MVEKSKKSKVAPGAAADGEPMQDIEPKRLEGRHWPGDKTKQQNRTNTTNSSMGPLDETEAAKHIDNNNICEVCETSPRKTVKRVKKVCTSRGSPSHKRSCKRCH